MSEQVYKCPCCDADIQFDSGSEQVVCGGCGNTFDAGAVLEYNEESSNESYCFSWNKYESSGDISEGLCFAECRACSVVFAAADKAAFGKCPCCDSALYPLEQSFGFYRPDVVVPFSKSKEDAKKSFTSFFKKRLLLPKGFMAESRMEQMQPVYLPFWIFDCAAEGKTCYDAQKEKRWSDKDFKYTKTNRFMAVRGGKADFEPIPVQAFSALDCSYIKAIEPFDLSQGVDFENAGMALSLTCETAPESVKSAAEEIIKQNTEKLLSDTIKGFDSVSKRSCQVSVSGGKVTFGMLPVWILSTKYKNRIYRFVMNGQTGKFIGELPLSKMKLLLMFLAIAAGITLIGAIITLLFF